MRCKNTTERRRAQINFRNRTWLVTLGLLVSITGFFIPVAVSAQPTGYQEYYVLGYEEHIWRAFLAIFDGSDDLIPGQICSTVGLVATADYQVIYYDHWEDGYEPNLLNPTQSTTRIFGDGDVNNGGQGGDILFAGHDITLTSDQDSTSTPEINRFVPVDSGRDPNDIRYDGGDRIISSGGPVALTHAMWPYANSWAGGAWEVYSRQTFENAYSYRLPVGEDLYDFGGGDTGTYGDFRDVILQVGAFENNTIVSIDNHYDVVNLALDQGWMYSSLGYINSSTSPSITINSGTTIRSNKPIQVGLATGADSPSTGFQGRFFAILPDQQWGADYIVPIPRGSDDPSEVDPAEVYLTNPNDFPITVHAYDSDMQTTFVISPAGNISATVPYSEQRGGQFAPQGSAARFTSTDGVFGVMVAVDTSDVTYDWGFSGIPSELLADDYYVSWAPGTTDFSDNGSPVWVTPLADDTDFFVDLSPTDGTIDDTFALDVLQQRRIFDNVDNDNTGMHVWATGNFALVWGEDPIEAGPPAPYLDLGVSALPPLQQWLDPVLTLVKEVNPSSLPTSGGTVTFTLTAKSFDSLLSDVDITDTLPQNWSYVPNSTRVTYPNGSIGLPEPLRQGRVLFWDLSTGLDINQNMTLTFQAQITNTAGITISTNQGEAIGRDAYSSALFNPSDETSVYISPLRLVKSVSSTRSGIGSTLIYTLSYSNLSTTVAAVNTRLRDTIPIQHVAFQSASAGGSYDAASGSVNWSLGNLAPGETGVVTFAVKINSFAQEGTIVRNSAWIESDRAKSGSNQVYTLVTAPQVTLSKSAPDTAVRGQLITYTLSYQNTGSNEATGVKIFDAEPLATTYISNSLAINTGSGWTALSDAADSDQGAFISPTLIITPGVNAGTLSPDEAGQIRFSVRINNVPATGTLVLNSATFDHDSDIPRESNTVVTRISDLALRKTAEQSVVVPGGLISFSLTYENASQAISQTNVLVEEKLPSFTRLIPFTASGGDSIEYSFDNGATWTTTFPVTPVTHLRWFDASMPANTRESISFAVVVDTILPPNTTIRNSARITSTENASQSSDWVWSNEVSIDTIDLQVEKQVTPTAAQPGAPISYTIYYGNRGSTDAVGVRIEDTPPPSTTYSANSIWGGGADDSGDPLLVWDVLTVTAGSSLQAVGFVVISDPGLPPGSVVTNAATLSNALGLFTSQPVTTTISGPTEPLLSLSKSAHAQTVAPGERLTYTLHITNHGQPAQGLVVSDRVPISTSFASCAGPMCSLSGDTVTWGPLDLGAGAVLDLSLVVKANEGLSNGVKIVNRDYWLTAENAPLLTGLPITITVSVPELDLFKWVYPSDEVFAGSRLDYSIQVVNSGGPASQLVVSDTLPKNTTYGGCDCSITRLEEAKGVLSEQLKPCGALFSCALQGSKVVWNAYDVPSDRTLRMTFWVWVDSGLADGTLIINEDYEANADDLTFVQGNQTITTTVRDFLVSISKIAWPDPVFLHQSLLFTITVQNQGGLLENVEITDLLPSGVSFVACGPQQQPYRLCEPVGDEQREVLWWFKELATGSEEELTLLVSVDNVRTSFIVNEFYSLRITDGLLPRYVTGSPVVVRVIFPIYLPVLLSNYSP